MNNRRIFNFLFQATENHPWLKNKEDAVYDLLNKDCENDKETETVIDIIEKFKFISHDEFRQLLNELTELITSTQNTSDSNSQIVAMAADSAPDSSQNILYHLKSLLQKKGWENHIMVNRFSRSYQEFKRNDSKHENIFLIDDFIGSGQTVTGRVKEIERIYTDNNIDNITIKVRTIAATEKGLERIKKEGIDASSIIVLKKAIDDFHDAREAHTRKLAMKKIEEKLSTSYRERDMPSLGYGEAQVAYYIEDTNTSNNVFPIFWWPIKKNGEKRNTILVRATGDA